MHICLPEATACTSSLYFLSSPLGISSKTLPTPLQPLKEQTLQCFHQILESRLPLLTWQAFSCVRSPLAWSVYAGETLEHKQVPLLHYSDVRSQFLLIPSLHQGQRFFLLLVKRFISSVKPVKAFHSPPTPAEVQVHARDFPRGSQGSVLIPTVSGGAIIILVSSL